MAKRIRPAAFRAGSVVSFGILILFISLTARLHTVLGIPPALVGAFLIVFGVVLYWITRREGQK